MYHFWVTVILLTLTYVLVSRIIMSEAYLLHSLRYESQIWCVDASLGWQSVPYQFWVTVILTSDLVFRIIASRAYLLYYLRQESQIWCVDAFWNGGVPYVYYFQVTVTLTSDLVSIIIMSGVYLLY